MTSKHQGKSSFYTIDRIEGEVAVLQDDAGRKAVVPLHRLPRAVREGDVVAVYVDADGVALWHRSVVDAAETERRRAAAARLLEEVRRRKRGEDPG